MKNKKSPDFKKMFEISRGIAMGSGVTYMASLMTTIATASRIGNSIMHSSMAIAAVSATAAAGFKLAGTVDHDIKTGLLEKLKWAAYGGLCAGAAEFAASTVVGLADPNNIFAHKFWGLSAGKFYIFGMLLGLFAGAGMMIKDRMLKSGIMENKKDKVYG